MDSITLSSEMLKYMKTASNPSSDTQAISTSLTQVATKMGKLDNNTRSALLKDMDFALLMKNIGANVRQRDGSMNRKVVSAMLTVAILSASEENVALADKFAIEGAIPLIASTLLLCQPSDETIGQSCFTALRGFSLKESHRAKFLLPIDSFATDPTHASQLVVCALCQGMKKFSSSMTIQGQAYSLMANLSVDGTRMKDELVKADIIPISITILKKAELNDQKAVSRICIFLRNLSLEHELSQRMIWSEGATDVLFGRVLQIFQGVADITENALMVLVNTMTSQNAFREALYTRSPSSKIIKLGVANISRAPITLVCLSFLYVLAENSESMQLEIGKSEGIQYVLKAMTTHKKDKPIIDKACQLLRKLAFLDENRTTIRNLHGIETILEAVELLFSVPDALPNALLALANATYSSPESKEVAASKNASDTVAQAMDVNRSSALVQEYGCRVLRNLSDGSGTNVQQQINGESIRVLSLVLFAYSDEAAVLEQALATLNNLTKEPAAIRKIEELHITGELDYIIEKFQTNENVSNQAKVLRSKLKSATLKKSGGRLLERAKS
eukprot:CAMPEP_0184697518 /NCGR_PEP_ID=MMETSP0313-20130426/4462_1 /TAXON_ID=2792 /ORGANISM="Porphyridium aerugineum, Strain SAG 1380-2" /LENGTH=560 /DNA_ID=CAMNT_0027156327 /DNA_START=176 /DNA_END=1855 /DNA_ORIENTATION=+